MREAGCRELRSSWRVTSATSDTNEVGIEGSGVPECLRDDMS